MSSSLACCPLRTRRRLRVRSLPVSRCFGRSFSALGQLVRGNAGRRLVADFDGLRDLHLERRVEQRDPTDLLEIGVDRVLRAAR